MIAHAGLHIWEWWHYRAPLGSRLWMGKGTVWVFGTQKVDDADGAGEISGTG